MTPMSCDRCGDTFTRACSFSKHRNRCHPMVCTVCGVTFFRRYRRDSAICSNRCATARGVRRTHGLSHRVPEYDSWSGMKARCLVPTNPGYHRYGGRGIAVCERWRGSFEAFLEDMGPRPTPAHSIDRINNDGNYEPGNCRWATVAEQARNRIQNHFVTYQGQRLCVLDACAAAGRSLGTVSRRIREGEDPQGAFDRPIDHVKSRAGKAAWLKRAA